MDSSSPPTDEDFDPAQRRLCPDGACVGVIGADGKCSVCGRTEAEAADGVVTTAPEQPEAPDSVGFDPTRRLCDDGACVGIVGDDGVCRACGRRSE
jgi:hypothetical protein